MRSSSYTLATNDGVPVHVHRWLPDHDDAVRGAVQVAHGLAEHGARYAPLAERLTAAGYAVHADDHRGHGRTAADPDDLGFFAERQGWARVLDDLYRLNRTIRTAHAGVPVVLLGHSMGSFLTQQFLFTFPGVIDGAVLSGTNGPIGARGDAAAVLARAERLRLGPRGRSRLLDQLSFGSYNRAVVPARTPFDWLSRDEAVVDAYLDDPWCGFLPTTQLWVDLFGGLRVIQQQYRLAGIPRDLPILVVTGDQDPVGDATAGVRRLLDLYDRVGLRRVTQHTYPGARHEILNETNREEVVDDLLTWLDTLVTGTAAA